MTLTLNIKSRIFKVLLWISNHSTLVGESIFFLAVLILGLASWADPLTTIALLVSNAAGIPSNPLGFQPALIPHVSLIVASCPPPHIGLFVPPLSPSSHAMSISPQPPIRWQCPSSTGPDFVIDRNEHFLFFFWFHWSPPIPHPSPAKLCVWYSACPLKTISKSFTDAP